MEKEVERGAYIFAEACRYPGAEHQRQGMACEDVLYIRETAEFCFYGLADGRSGASHGAEGGMACLEAAADFLQHSGVAGLAGQPFPDEIPCLLMRKLRRRLLCLSQERGVEFREYASTLLAIGLDPATGQYVLLHLGDGCAVLVREFASMDVLGPPENGISNRHTWLTTAENAVPHLKVMFGTIRRNDRLLLMSDGVSCLCYGKNIPRQARALMLTGTREEITDHVRRANPRDDASCIVLDFLPGPAEE